MIKIIADLDGRPVMMIGLSHKNLADLKAAGWAQQTTIATRGQHGLPFDIMLASGETDQEMLRAVASGVDENTQIEIDPKLKS